MFPLLAFALQAGVLLKKVRPEAHRPAAPAGDGGRFVPNPADLLKLKAGLRKTNPGAAEEQPAEQSAEQPTREASIEEQAETAAKQLEPEPEAAPSANAPCFADVADDVAPMEAAAEPAAQPLAEPGKAVVAPAPAAAAADEAATAGNQVSTQAPSVPTQAAAPAQPVDVAMEDALSEAEALQVASAADTQAPAQGPAAADAVASEQPVAAADVAVDGTAVAAAAEGHAAALAPGSPQRKRVRFVEGAASTPEGAARDATITIRLRRGDLEQARAQGRACLGLHGLHVHRADLRRGGGKAVLAASSRAPPRGPHAEPSIPAPLCNFAMQIINVDDNTVAFAQWGLGSMAGGEQEELPDTVVSKRGRHSVAAPPASAGKSPGACGAAALLDSQGCAGVSRMAGPGSLPGHLHTCALLPNLALNPAVPTALRELLAGQSPLPSTTAQRTPAGGGLLAPAPTPATAGLAAGASVAGRVELVVDHATLAAKLAEMAGQHDVTLEVPAVSAGDNGGVAVGGREVAVVGRWW